MWTKLFLSLPICGYSLIMRNISPAFLVPSVHIDGQIVASIIVLKMPPEQQLVRLQPIFTRKRLDELFKSLHELDLEKDICDRELTRFGFGASSDVFRARSKRHNKRVAVKCIRIFLLEDESFAKV